MKCIWTVLLSLTFIPLVFCCWGRYGTKYGETFGPPVLLVGSDLIINCSLYKNISLNSSLLTFKKDGDDQNLSNNIHLVNNLTAQLRIPNAQVTDSGLYLCLLAPDNNKQLVCGIHVNVGYPPHDVSNFNCVSRNFDNLTCTWDVEPNSVRTDYALSKTILLQEQEDCPELKPKNNTFCQWRHDTYPPYQVYDEKLTFTVRGNNSLGEIKNVFTFDHFAIVVPNPPKDLVVLNKGRNFLAVQWSPPDMNHIMKKPPLYYQLQLNEVDTGAENITVVNLGVNVFNHKFNDLVPFLRYKVSVRCRSNQTDIDSMWSESQSIVSTTLEDVPYYIPDMHSEAYAIRKYGNYSNVTLYWKPIPSRFYNGEKFQYEIECSSMTAKKISYSFIFVENMPAPTIEIGPLDSNLPHMFSIHSANRIGKSYHYRAIFVETSEKTLPPPKYFRAISHQLGSYNLSWSPAGHSDAQIFTVFWCAGQKPGECQQPIQWAEMAAGETSFSLDIPEAVTDFQFAISVRENGMSSGMHWAPCVVSSNAPLGKIPFTVEPMSAGSLHVSWQLSCDAFKSVIDHYDVTYCRITDSCEVVQLPPDIDGYLITGLERYANYSVKLQAFNKENKPSEDMDPIYQVTVSEDSAVFIGVAIGCTFAVALLLMFAYKLVIWMSAKIHQVKNIAVRLPKELEGPETNPLNIYSYKHQPPTLQPNLNPTISTPTNQPTPIDQDNKNRHGSGSSELSHTSSTTNTDELIFKNGKCAKFSRKPSGDSSGCSSLSSNTTNRIHLSSDSGTESDFVAPASPDSAITEPTLQQTQQKTPMPILMEMYDTPSKHLGMYDAILVKQSPIKNLKNLSCTSGQNKNLEKYGTTGEQHAYSKFGVAPMNSLAFYSYNLANSEPSVFGEYAKSANIGSAKSSSSLFGPVTDMGYSKFAMVPRRPQSTVSTVQGERDIMKDAVNGGYTAVRRELNSMPEASYKGPISGYVRYGDIDSLAEANGLSDSGASFCQNDFSDGDFVTELEPWNAIDLPSTDALSGSLDPLQLIDPKVLDQLLTNRNLNDAFSPSQTESRTSESPVNGDAFFRTPIFADGHLESVPSNNYETLANDLFPREVLLSPETIPNRNGYVPFSMTVPCSETVPKSADLHLSVFPSDSILDENYVTPANKSELKLLQNGLVVESRGPFDHTNYTLKPLQRIRTTEVCEV